MDETSGDVVEVERDVIEEMRWSVIDSVNRAELAQERLSDLYDSLDNVGWRPLSGTGDGERGPMLSQLRIMAAHCRTMFAGNPMAQQGIEIRTGYVWGTGIEVKDASGKTSGIPTLTKANRNSLFSTRAQLELEACAATDGNVFMLLDRNKKKAVWIPMEQITAVMADPDDPNTAIFYRRSYTVHKMNGERTDVDTWYAAHDYSGVRPRSLQDRPVAPANLAIVQASVNTQRGWHFGLPDLFNVTWWLSSYKEYIEAGFSVTKALAKFAVKSTAPTKAGMNRAAAKLSPAYASDTGSTPGYGQMVNTSGGADISAISKSGAEFDFTSGRAIAAMTAMGLGVDVDALTGENKLLGDNVMTPATVKRMIQRQGVWDDFLSAIGIFFGVPNPNIRFPPVRTVAVHRALQAVATAAATGVLFPQEVRNLTVSLLVEYGIEQEPGMPKAGEWAKFAAPPPPPQPPAQVSPPNDGQGAGGDPAHPGTTPQKTPNATKSPRPKGQRTPAGPLADGDNSMRNSNK